jgi:hypothetical protein
MFFITTLHKLNELTNIIVSIDAIKNMVLEWDYVRLYERNTRCFKAHRIISMHVVVCSCWLLLTCPDSSTGPIRNCSFFKKKSKNLVKNSKFGLEFLENRLEILDLV